MSTHEDWGLAPLKREGFYVDCNTGKEVTKAEYDAQPRSKRELIEIWYDPSSEIDTKVFDAVIDILKGCEDKYREETVAAIMKVFA